MVVQHTIEELWSATPIEYKLAFLRNFYSYSDKIHRNVETIMLFKYKYKDGGFALQVFYTDGRKVRGLHNLDWDIVMQIIDGYYLEDVKK